MFILPRIETDCLDYDMDTQIKKQPQKIATLLKYVIWFLDTPHNLKDSQSLHRLMKLKLTQKYIEKH